MNISNTEVLIILFEYECFEHKVLSFAYIFVSESDEDFINEFKFILCFGK
jgi:hypothetical protein